MEEQRDNPTDEVVKLKDPLSLDLDDKKLVKTLKDRRENAKSWFDTELNLETRVKRNLKYSTQVDRLMDANSKLKGYEGKWMDNIIWEAQQQIQAISFSKMPDIIVTPGREGEESQKTADGVSKVLDTDIKKRERREVLEMAFNHEPKYLRGIIKWRWNPELGKNGDKDFEWVNPDDIVVDETAKTNDQKDMDFIAQRLHPSIKELIMRFPDKKKEIIKTASKDGVSEVEDGETNDKGMATKPEEVWETWFTEYVEHDGEWERVEGVAWTYRDLMLKKQKDPNWDWRGEKRLFSYDTELKEEDMRQSILDGTEIEGFREETVFRNYFENPEKPYIFLNSELDGQSSINATSWLEQLILMQYTVDERGKVIAEKLKNRTKHIFSSDTGLKAEDVQDMDLSDPDQDIWIHGKVGDVHGAIPPDLPTAQEFKDYEDTRSRMFAKAGTFATRGEIQSDTATSNQIAREADFTRADNLVGKTINYAAERMARAELQLMKLRYSEDHFTKILGEDGKVTFQKIHRDMIEDGMEVIVTASGTDKIKAERRAMDMAKMKLIDPFTFYSDIGANDPSGRTMKLMLFLQSPAEYTAKYAMGLQDNQQMGNALNGADGRQASLDIQQLQQGQQPNVPENPQPEYLQTFNQFLQSQEFQELPPEVQQMIVQFAQAVTAKAQGQAENPAAQQFGQEGAPQQPQQPSPQNPSTVPTEAPQLPQGSVRNL